MRTQKPAPMLRKPGERTPKTRTPRRERHVITLAPDVAAEVREVAARHAITPKRLVKLALADAEARNTRKPRRVTLAESEWAWVDCYAKRHGCAVAEVMARGLRALKRAESMGAILGPPPE